jgi:hypothetical protein
MATKCDRVLDELKEVFGHAKGLVVLPQDLGDRLSCQRLDQGHAILVAQNQTNHGGLMAFLRKLHD